MVGPYAQTGRSFGRTLSVGTTPPMAVTGISHEYSSKPSVPPASRHDRIISVHASPTPYLCIADGLAAILILQFAAALGSIPSPDPLSAYSAFDCYRFHGD